MTRDLSRLRDVLGANSQPWNALRAEAFLRIAGQGEGAMENGVRLYSGAKFATAWSNFTRGNRNVADVLFTPYEQGQISNLAATGQRVTGSVRGGDLPSNTPVGIDLIKKLPFMRAASHLIQILPGGKELSSALGAAKTRSFTYGAAPAKAAGIAVSRPVYGRVGGAIGAQVASGQAK